MPGAIPCSVNMLTRNSAGTLEAALESVSDFAEIVIGDGRSTDATRAIAARYGCRVVDQDPRYTDAAGRLLDYAGARSQLIAMSSEDWILFLDSDEILTREAAATITDVFSVGVPPEIGAYRLQAKHVINGMTIEDGSKFGMRLSRLFRRSAVEHFAGFVDEAPAISPGYLVNDLDAVFLLPLPPVRHLIPKWVRYLRVFALEATKKGPDWTDQQLPGKKSSVRWLIRGWLEARRRGHPNRMPFRYEAGQVLLAGGIYVTLRLVRLSQRFRRKP
jgi:glycosyltransferase involved in cell wall biosynthesis